MITVFFKGDDKTVRGVREYLAESMDMPKDVMMDLPKLSVCGDKEIYIENHKGLLEYSDEIISVKIRYISIIISNRVGSDG